ncbi:unnamed protein product [Rhizoctonia solani]|uniref:Uncharacterized protein n=1 Tax=Rhizoctonia solani TaxID=456999 RepID=A0A8H3DUU4_9AGAM|nr:unnamed protein product [Rhizoctonia solani]
MIHRLPGFNALIGTPWTLENPNTGQLNSATTERTTLEKLCPPRVETRPAGVPCREVEPPSVGRDKVRQQSSQH